MQIKPEVRWLLSAAALLFASAAETQQPATPRSTPGQAGQARQSGERRAAKPTIVLVHGAFADASSWNEVIPLLQDRGYSVVAVQNPLTSVATDIATTRRVVDAQPGDVVLVGHSYGGAVITEAGAGSPKVKALVYIAAFAPEPNVPIGAPGKNFPAPALSAALRPDAAGFLYIDTARFHDVFARDLPVKRTRVLAAGQKPVTGAAFGTSLKAAAWKTVPSWYLVAQQDRAINPDEERFYARRMKARTTEVPTSHVPFLSQPQAVARIILDAAESVQK
jgi:pimeloyl-ACP methyl ester carboxylesterase